MRDGQIVATCSRRIRQHYAGRRSPIESRGGAGRSDPAQWKKFSEYQDLDHAIVLTILLALCLMVTVWVAIRRPVIFKMGFRNIPRRKAQTILIVVGLMLSTLIISAAMTSGDTLNNSANAEIYELLGHVDEVVVFSTDPEDASIINAISYSIPESALTLVEETLAGNPLVDGIAPTSLAFVPIINETTGLGEPEVSMAGYRPDDLAAFGGLHWRRWLGH